MMYAVWDYLYNYRPDMSPDDFMEANYVDCDSNMTHIWQLMLACYDKRLGENFYIELWEWKELEHQTLKNFQKKLHSDD